LNTGDDESIAHTLRKVETADVRRGSVSPLTTALYEERDLSEIIGGINVGHKLPQVSGWKKSAAVDQ